MFALPPLTVKGRINKSREATRNISLLRAVKQNHSQKVTKFGSTWGKSNIDNLFGLHHLVELSITILFPNTKKTTTQNSKFSTNKIDAISLKSYQIKFNVERNLYLNSYFLVFGGRNNSNWLRLRLKEKLAYCARPR